MSSHVISDYKQVTSITQLYSNSVTVDNEEATYDADEVWYITTEYDRVLLLLCSGHISPVSW